MIKFALLVAIIYLWPCWVIPAAFVSLSGAAPLAVAPALHVPSGCWDPARSIGLWRNEMKLTTFWVQDLGVLMNADVMCNI